MPKEYYIDYPNCACCLHGDILHSQIDRYTFA